MSDMKSLEIEQSSVKLAKTCFQEYDIRITYKRENPCGKKWKPCSGLFALSKKIT